MTHRADDFYEDDEPVDEVVAAYEAGPHVITANPDIDSMFVVHTHNVAVGSLGYTHAPGVVTSGGRVLITADR